MDLVSRRRFLALTGAGAAGVTLAACGDNVRREAVAPGAEAVAAAEGRRRLAGAVVREVAITAGPVTTDLGGVSTTTWAYGSLPATELRLRAGEVLRARFTNNLPEPTTIHWHGIAIRNDMDGVPGMTQEPVPPGGSFTYEFTTAEPGTYWFHPHSGLQLDRGLYGALVVEDPSEQGAYDREIVIVLDDWTDGLSTSPEMAFEDLRLGRGAHAAHLAAAKEGGGDIPTSDFLQSPPGDVSYPLFLMNGRRPSSPPTFDARPGERLRLRIINAGADTPFRVAVGGHRMTVTHTDGFPIDPTVVDALVIGMAERYDATVTVNQAGVFPIVAVAEAKGAQANGLIRTGAGTAPAPDVRPAELTGKVLRLSDVRSAQRVRLPEGRPDRLFALELGGGEEGYVWTMNGKPHSTGEPLQVYEGERVRLAFHNTTTMFHPMHLHGHTFQVVLPDGEPGARKDTAIVRPNQRLAVDFVADNPGQWMIHCHNLYHQQGGMMTTLSYVDDVRGGSKLGAGLKLTCDWLGGTTSA